MINDGWRVLWNQPADDRSYPDSSVIHASRLGSTSEP